MHRRKSTSWARHNRQATAEYHGSRCAATRVAPAPVFPRQGLANGHSWSLNKRKNFGHIRVHDLYKPTEIPANTSLPAFAVSVTYRKH
jgi:hypothetical protein